MKVYFLNLQEIRGIRFGTRNPVNYFDNFYNSELFLRTHGSYSIKITDPIRFYTEVVPRNASHLEVEDINQQFLDEFKSTDNKSEFHNKWFKFETYRKIVCTDNFWMI